MIKRLCLTLGWLGLYACQPAPFIAPSSGITGYYQFTQYVTEATNDQAPVGSITLTAIDSQHVDLLARGRSGNTSITYTYRRVDVISTGLNYLGDETFRLVYKNRQIGVINGDDQGRYISLNPRRSVVLMATLPGAED